MLRSSSRLLVATAPTTSVVVGVAGLRTSAAALDSKAKPMVRNPTDVHPYAKELGLKQMDLGVRFHSAESGIPLNVDLKHLATAPDRKTVFHDLHVELGAKMVPFAGWTMPVQYPAGLLKEHAATRTAAGLFDVSHMRQLRITGKDRVKFIEYVSVADISTAPVGSTKLSVYLNESGGIIDDTMITRQENHLYIVVNAGCADKDIAHLRHHIRKFDAHLEVLEQQSLLALQGPKAATIFEGVTKTNLTNFDFMSGRTMKIDDIPVYVTRCGYTGEDGFEISVHDSQAVRLARILLANKDIQPAGLGCRDSLRLEAGLCLYGHDIDERISPIEAGLNFVISKRRREAGGFMGAATVQDHLKNGVTKRRIGLTVESGAPAREGTTIHSATGEEIGHVTSGSPSPTSGKKIAMGYVKEGSHKAGTKLQVKTRGKISPATVVTMPFVPTKYYRAPVAK